MLEDQYLKFCQAQFHLIANTGGCSYRAQQRTRPQLTVMITGILQSSCCQGLSKSKFSSFSDLMFHKKFHFMRICYMALAIIYHFGWETLSPFIDWNNSPLMIQKIHFFYSAGAAGLTEN